jgi:hypothetical protein
VDAGKASNSQGCILPGEYVMRLGDQLGVSSSVKTMRTLLGFLGRESFTLRIVSDGEA